MGDVVHRIVEIFWRCEVDKRGGSPHECQTCHMMDEYRRASGWLVDWREEGSKPSSGSLKSTPKR